MMRTLVGIVAAAAAVAGCGDPLLCKSDVFVAVQTTNIVEDLDAAPGVQGDIRIRTSLEPGEIVTVTILDATGLVTGTAASAVDGEGNATIRATVPTPRATVLATATSTCGEGRDEVTFDVIAGTGCTLAITPTPLESDFYAPLRVLPGSLDANPAPGFQASVTVATRADWTVELYATSNVGEEKIGTGTATGGIATFVDLTLREGQVGLRATCDNQSSAVTTVYVDTTPPACAITAPAEGATITPGMDADGDLTNGLQLEIFVGTIASDVAFEPYTIEVTPAGGSTVTLTGALDATGEGGGTATVPATSGTAVTIELETQDRATNRCVVSNTYDVVLDGCEIAITAPTAAVVADVAPGTPGAQVDVDVTVAAACVGRTVTSVCGTNSPSAVVPAGGNLTLQPTVCATSPCEASVACLVSVTTASGVTTTAATTIVFDNAAPVVDVAIVDPAIACGSQVSPANDADPIAPGVQVVARVTSADAATKALRVTNANGVSTVDAAGDVIVTLAPGTNTFLGSGTDALGNVGQDTCVLALNDLTVSFAAPAADGLVNENDGTVAGMALTFPLCGTVSASGATVTVAIDGGAAQPAIVTGTSWCRTITIAQSPPAHTIVVAATSGMSAGVGTLVLEVDVVDPGAVADFAVTSPDRQTLTATWTAPSDGGGPVERYVVKFSTVALTDANFDTTGVVFPSPTPGAPGSAETFTVFPASTGTTVWVGIATYDAAGNRSAARIVGPITPTFDQSGVILPTEPLQGSLQLGSAIAFGKFDGDELMDVAVAAPSQQINGVAGNVGAVYVYFGRATGLSATPDLKITNAIRDGHIGGGLAAVRWSSATHDDLVVGAPGLDVGNGRVYVFATANLAAGTRTVQSAELSIGVNTAMPGWFAGSALGANLAAGDLDGDGVFDLAIAAPRGGGNVGGVAVVYGPVTATTSLSDVDPTGLAGATVALITDPLATTGKLFGNYVHVVDDDLVIAYADDVNATGDQAFVYRGDGTRPAIGLTPRAFTVGRDVRLELVTTYRTAEFASQVTSIEDQNGDGARELVIGAYRNVSNGQVLIIDGDTLGTAGVARTTDPGVVLTTITGGTGARFGAAIATHDPRTNPDVNGDGREDLLVAGLNAAPSGSLFVWFGGAIPVGAVAASTAPYKIAGPTQFLFSARAGGTGQARWVGDVNGDGLDDVVWASFRDNADDGAFELLFDE